MCLTIYELPPDEPSSLSVGSAEPVSSLLSPDCESPESAAPVSSPLSPDCESPESEAPESSLLLPDSESLADSLFTVMSKEPAQLIGFCGAELEKIQASRW